MRKKNCFFEQQTASTDKVDIKEQKRECIKPSVPRFSIDVKKENPLSKRLRQFDNLSITHPPEFSMGVYITTNEEQSEVIAEQLSKIPLVPQSCHIGFSGWHNLDIMALRRSGLGIICDHNPENALFLHFTLKILINSINREDFIRQIISFVDINRGNHNLQERNSLAYSIKFSPNFRSNADSLSPSREISNHLKVATGWLANEDRFQFIKGLALTDRIVLLTEDILTTDTFSKIRKLLQENSVQIDTLYLSNISAYMYTPEQQDAFIKSIRTLSEYDTNMIDARQSYYLFQSHDALNQRLTTHKLLFETDKAARWLWGDETREEYLQRETPEERRERQEFSNRLFNANFSKLFVSESESSSASSISQGL